MLRSIPALEKVEMIRVGYAIEYDFVPPDQTKASLESKVVPGLFLAGQINGTSGYEEAAAQGIIAGINAALKVKGEPPLILRRDQAYIGVLIDDLITKEHTEPYRMFTSRCEYRLLMRQDNADLRLTPIAYKLGLVSRERYERVERKRELIEKELLRLRKTYMFPSKELIRKMVDKGLVPIAHDITLIEFLRRPEVKYETLKLLGYAEELPEEVEEEVEIEAKYEGYIAQQRAQVERMRRLEEMKIPDIDYSEVKGLRNEARYKLEKFKPMTIGQASRIAGINPSDIAVLLIHLERMRAPR